MLTKVLIMAMIFLGPASLGTPSSVPKEVVGESGDQPYIAIEKFVPGFAGMYLEGMYLEGTSVIHIMLQEPTDEALEQARILVLGSILGNDVQYRGATAVAHRADYSYSELAKWKDIATAQMGAHNSHSVGIGQKENRLLLGLDKESLAPGKVIDDLVQRGVPKEAILIFEDSGVQTLPIIEDPPYALYALLIVALLGLGLVGWAIQRKVSRSLQRGRERTS
ncbi:MAG: hypothetical protein HYR89_02650 [Actinobacteria bacterium]|nr:hypothetical protein [Actinomycetota bacterium]